MGFPISTYDSAQVSSAAAALSSALHGGESDFPWAPSSTSSSYTTRPTSAPTPTSTNPASSNIADNLQHSKDFWEKLATGAKIGIIVAIVIGVLVIVLLSVWFCCGCCGLRRRNAKRNEVLHPQPDTDTVPLQNRQPPVTTMNRMASTVNRMASTRTRMSGIAPPLYAEVAPPQHTTIAGGITHMREEEEGIISDGKTPLSEIPFEDVVLDHSPSEGSARNFGDRHLRLGGDTTGHTNS
ncbi:hypothetical protein BDZ45DRAFT_677922 [Acephala macrosclerotiorum]|nr:hypothetical protein BDZ45DRAFT_677922 [Acephala macrosclerotiorum]